MRSRLIRPASAILLIGGGLLLVAVAGFPDRCKELDPVLIEGGSIAATGGFALGLAWWTQRRSLHARLGGGQEFPGDDLNGVNLSLAKYDDDTRWPSNIDPEAAGAIKVSRPWWRRVFGG